MNSHQRLEATITASCTIKVSSPSGIAALNQNILKTIPLGNTVYSGPTPEEYQGMASTYFDVSNKSTEGGNTVIARFNIHVATDSNTKLLETWTSQSISGTGNSQYLKVLNFQEEVTRDARGIGPEEEIVDPAESSDSFQFKITQSLELEKPWYAPKELFISKAKEGILSDFVTTANKDAETVAEQLTESVE
jgi:hypothetical protein